MADDIGPRRAGEHAGQLTVAGGLTPGERVLAKSRRGARKQVNEGQEAEEAPTLRDRIEVYLFLAVEIVCILLFVDFLFIGWYVK